MTATMTTHEKRQTRLLAIETATRIKNLVKSWDDVGLDDVAASEVAKKTYMYLLSTSQSKKLKKELDELINDFCCSHDEREKVADELRAAIDTINRLICTITICGGESGGKKC